MSDSNSSSGGIGLGGALFVLFLGLKLTGFIDWAWVWIFAPLWVPFAIFLIIVAIAGIVIGIGNLLDKRRSKKRRQAAWERINKRA